jgi:hypothetical protein
MNSIMPNNEQNRKLIVQHIEYFLREITPSGNYEVSVSSIKNGVASITITTADPFLAELLLAIEEEEIE